MTLAIGAERRLVATEDVARYRDGIGTVLPQGLPDALLAAVPDPSGDLALRYARSHGAFTTADFAARYGLDTDSAESLLRRVARGGRVIEGEFRPGGTEREWIDAECAAHGPPALSGAAAPRDRAR